MSCIPTSTVSVCVCGCLWIQFLVNRGCYIVDSETGQKQKLAAFNCSAMWTLRGHRPDIGKTEPWSPLKQTLSHAMYNTSVGVADNK